MTGADLETLWASLPEVPQPMSLVDDEIVHLDHKGETEAFRLRVWRARDRSSVVLASQVPGHIPTWKCSALLANLAYRVFLAYDPWGLHFVEKNGRDLKVVSFVAWGREDRCYLVRPEYHAFSRLELEALIGRPLDELGFPGETTPRDPSHETKTARLL
jgi:hypothetical protein